MKPQTVNMLELQPSLQVSVVMGDNDEAIRKQSPEDEQYKITFKEKHLRCL